MHPWSIFAARSILISKSRKDIQQLFEAAFSINVWGEKLLLKNQPCSVQSHFGISPDFWSTPCGTTMRVYFVPRLYAIFPILIFFFFWKVSPAVFDHIWVFFSWIWSTSLHWVWHHSESMVFLGMGVLTSIAIQICAALMAHFITKKRSLMGPTFYLNIPNHWYILFFQNIRVFVLLIIKKKKSWQIGLYFNKKINNNKKKPAMGALKFLP